jgi:hypothetical protein
MIVNKYLFTREKTFDSELSPHNLLPTYTRVESMNKKRSLESRIRGWFPCEPTLSKIPSTKINAQPLPIEPRLIRHRMLLGIAGGVLSVLVALGVIYVGVIFTGVFSDYGMYVTGWREPMQEALNLFIQGGVGLAMGVLGIVGCRSGKRSGGYMLIVAGVANLLLFFFFGIPAAVLMLLSGSAVLRKNPPPPMNSEQKTMFALGAMPLRTINFILFGPLLFAGYILYWRVAHADPSPLPTMLIVGAVSGLIVGCLFIRWDLGKLAKRSEVVVSRMWLFRSLLVIYPLLGVGLVGSILGLTSGLLYWDFFSVHILSLGVLYILANIAWESQNNKRIYFGRDNKLYAIPATPQT